MQHFQQPEIRLEELDFLRMESFCVEVLCTSWFLGVVSIGCVLVVLLEKLPTSCSTDILSTSKQLLMNRCNFELIFFHRALLYEYCGILGIHFKKLPLFCMKADWMGVNLFQWRL